MAWICLTVARDKANHYYNGLPSLELIYVAQKYVNSNVMLGQVGIHIGASATMLRQETGIENWKGLALPHCGS